MHIFCSFYRSKLTPTPVQVRRDAPSAVRSSLVYGDDPHGWASAIQNDWVVDHKIFTGIYDEHGKPSKKPYTVIRVGDFVEVTTAVEIIKYRKRNGWATEARLSVQEVIRAADKATVEVSTSVTKRGRGNMLTMKCRPHGPLL